MPYARLKRSKSLQFKKLDIYTILERSLYLVIKFFSISFLLRHFDKINFIKIKITDIVSCVWYNERCSFKNQKYIFVIYVTFMCT